MTRSFKSLIAAAALALPLAMSGQAIEAQAQQLVAGYASHIDRSVSIRQSQQEWVAYSQLWNPDFNVSLSNAAIRTSCDQEADGRWRCRTVGIPLK